MQCESTRLRGAEAPWYRCRMRRRALLSGLLVGGLAVVSRALGVGPVLDIPLEPQDPEEEEAEPAPQPQPHSTEPPPSQPTPPGPDDDDDQDQEERPPTVPA